MKYKFIIVAKVEGNGTDEAAKKIDEALKGICEVEKISWDECSSLLTYYRLPIHGSGEMRELK